MILDTNAVSAMGDGDFGLELPLRNADEIALPVIVLGAFRTASGSREAEHVMRNGWRRFPQVVGFCR